MVSTLLFSHGINYVLCVLEDNLLHFIQGTTKLLHSSISKPSKPSPNHHTIHPRRPTPTTHIKTHLPPLSSIPIPLPSSPTILIRPRTTRRADRTRAHRTTPTTERITRRGDGDGRGAGTVSVRARGRQEGGRRALGRDTAGRRTLGRRVGFDGGGVAARAGLGRRVPDGLGGADGRAAGRVARAGLRGVDGRRAAASLRLARYRHRRRGPDVACPCRTAGR